VSSDLQRDQPDDAPLAEHGLDLSPRLPAGPARPRRGRRWGPIVVLGLVLVAGGVVVYQFLGNALDYYCNADEVGVKQQCSGSRSLRVQGTVERGSIEREATETRFVIAFNGVEIPVAYDGDPGGKFQECIPVVVRGRMENGTLQGNQLEVKHSNEYAAKNADRLDSTGPCPEAA
jgi:cytochrome c-type biogenesis protein CcmE